MSCLDHGLLRNERGTWVLDGVELTSGACFEVFVQGHWIRVIVEYEGAKGFVQPASIRLHRGLRARLLGQCTD